MCGYTFLNVKVTRGGGIIYNTRTRPSVQEVTTLQGLVPNMLARLIINKQSIATEQIFVMPKEEFSLFKDERYISINKSINVCALESTPHKWQSTNNMISK